MELAESSKGVRKPTDNITVEEEKIDNDDTETVQALGNSFFRLKNPSSAFTTYNNLNFINKS